MHLGDKSVEVGSFTESIGGFSCNNKRRETRAYWGMFYAKKVAKDIDVFAANNHSTTANSSIFLNADENITFDFYLNKCMRFRSQSL